LDDENTGDGGDNGDFTRYFGNVFILIEKVEFVIIILEKDNDNINKTNIKNDWIYN